MNLVSIVPSQLTILPTWGTCLCGSRMHTTTFQLKRFGNALLNMVSLMQMTQVWSQSTIESELQDLDGTLRELQSTQVDLAYCLGLEAPSACEELLDFDGQDNECCDPDCLDEDALVVDCLRDVGLVAETCPEDDESIEMVSIELAMESLRKLRVFVSTIGIDSMASKLVDIEFKRKLALLQSSLANDRRLEVVKNAKQKSMMDYIVRDA